MYCVYILKSKSCDHFYTGQTNSIVRRLEEHNSGNIYWTKRYKPWSVVYVEHFDNREEAVKREKYLKSHAGRNWIKKNIMRP